jgi:hypothetical protein
LFVLLVQVRIESHTTRMSAITTHVTVRKYQTVT